jgi:HSP20 family molecular chaperone IbpA
MMSTDRKFRVLAGFLMLCVLGLGFQGYLLWRMDEQLAAVEEDSIPRSIQRRLEAQLDKRAAQSGPAVASNWPANSSAMDPFARMQQMRQQMDSLFGSFSGFALPASPFTASQGFSFEQPMPNLELTETTDEYQLRVQTPPDHELTLNSELEANLLTVTGALTRNQSNTGQGMGSSFVSRSQFTRRFDLPEPVDELGVFTEATEGGVVIRVPKKA